MSDNQKRILKDLTEAKTPALSPVREKAKTPPPRPVARPDVEKKK